MWKFYPNTEINWTQPTLEKLVFSKKKEQQCDSYDSFLSFESTAKLCVLVSMNEEDEHTTHLTGHTRPKHISEGSGTGLLTQLPYRHLPNRWQNSRFHWSLVKWNFLVKLWPGKPQWFMGLHFPIRLNLALSAHWAGACMPQVAIEAMCVKCADCQSNPVRCVCVGRGGPAPQSKLGQRVRESWSRIGKISLGSSAYSLFSCNLTILSVKTKFCFVFVLFFKSKQNIHIHCCACVHFFFFLHFL